MKKTLLIFILAVAVFNTSNAQTAGAVVSNKPGWHKIADRHASYKADRDEIMLVGKRHFKQIKLKVEDATLNLTSFDVVYADDTKQTVTVNKMMAAGEETTPTDINANLPVKKVVLMYNTVGAKTTDVSTETHMNKKGEKEVEKEHEKETEKERAEVEVWGLQ